jgi:hypothetical protein
MELCQKQHKKFFLEKNEKQSKAKQTQPREEKKNEIQDSYH